ncbi:hypothetical protein N7536_008958 [Penicillium majusculum]|nr:hypothetical protein N7536_008958 [Penicillium majusculum]
MGGLRETIKSSKYRPDSDIAVLPFLRLELWVKDPATNVPAMSNDAYVHLHRRLVCLFDQTGIEIRLKKLLYMNQDIAVQQIESAIIDTNMFLETSLDELPGETASFLRLERFKNWFEDGTSWESSYETQLYNQLYQIHMTDLGFMTIREYIRDGTRDCGRRYFHLVFRRSAMFKSGFRGSGPITFSFEKFMLIRIGYIDDGRRKLESRNVDVHLYTV